MKNKILRIIITIDLIGIAIEMAKENCRVLTRLPFGFESFESSLLCKAKGGVSPIVENISSWWSALESEIILSIIMVNVVIGIIGMLILIEWLVTEPKTIRHRIKSIYTEGSREWKIIIKILISVISVLIIAQGYIVYWCSRE